MAHNNVSGRSSNIDGAEFIISIGSVIAVNDGQCMLIVEQGKVVDVCAEPGEYTYDTSSEPSIFCGGLGAGVKAAFQQVGKRFTFGGEPPKDQRVYFVNTKELVGNKYGTPNPVPFRVVDMNIGLEVLMDNPSSVGTDLIVGAVAGINRYPVPLILIDMGTATTICVVNENKQYIGGMILPGIGVSMNSLTSRTAQLPRISLDPPKRLIGKNTDACMQSGALYGNASCIDGMVDRIEEELGQKATVVATGGLARKIIPLCRHQIELDDELLLRGLWIIYKKNK